jgi:hypothetical protein
MIGTTLCYGGIVLVVAVLCLGGSYFIAGRLTGWIGQRVFKGSVTISERISPAIGPNIRSVQFAAVDQPHARWKTVVLNAIFHGTALVLILASIVVIFPILLGLLLPVFFPELWQQATR